MKVIKSYFWIDHKDIDIEVDWLTIEITFHNRYDPFKVVYLDEYLWWILLDPWGVLHERLNWGRVRMWERWVDNASCFLASFLWLY